MHNRVITVLFILFSSYTLFAQKDSVGIVKETTSNRISLELGFNSGYLKDLNFSPLNYSEGGSLFSVSYVRIKPQRKHMFTADIDFSSGTLKCDAVSFFTSEYMMGNVELSFLWKVFKPTNHKLTFFAGPQYNSFIQYVDWQGQESWTYLATHGLAMKGSCFYQASARRRFYSSLSVPVVQLFVRPPYNGYDLYIQEHSEEIAKIAFRGELASWNKYVAVDWKTVYQYALSRYVDFTLGYLLRYQHVSGYNKLVRLQNQFTTGLTVKF